MYECGYTLDNISKATLAIPLRAACPPTTAGVKDLPALS